MTGFYSSGPTERSGFHRDIEKLLDEMGVNYISEKGWQPYRVDIYIPEWHLAIEADGPMHNKWKDQKRDNFLLETYGVPVMRVSQNNYHKEACKKYILEFIEDFANSVATRKERARLRY